MEEYLAGLNEQQLEAATCDDRTILCLAGAGAGKTHTMLSRIERQVRSGIDPASILALTFTNAAAFEMKERYKKIPNIDLTKAVPEFRTFHSFCYSLIVKDRDVREKLGYTKIPELCDDMQLKELKAKVKLQIGCKLSDAILENDIPLSKKDQESKDLFQKALIKTIKKENLITFDMMCYNVCELFVQKYECIEKYRQKYKFIYCDEFQDTDSRQYKFISSFPNTTSFYLVADALQCQPAGTQVAMCGGGTKSIENIEEGDLVVTCSDAGNYNVNPKYGRRVTSVGRRFADNIVEVKTKNHSSRYTKDHLTYCKIHYEGNENAKCVYLMCNEEKGWWRIGQCSLFVNKGGDFGPKLRLITEKGDKVWLLDIRSRSNNEAWLVEQTAAFKFGIPDTTWKTMNVKNPLYNAEALTRLYDNIPDIRARAEACLEYFGRDIRYPFFDRKKDYKQHMSKLHKFEIRVGNLIPQFMDVVVPELFTDSKDKYRRNKLHTSYEQITSIERCSPDWVYSLDVEKWHNYVADGILTHNCIYQFRNCTNEYVKTLAKAPGWKVIKLTKNYRSVNKICNFANNFSRYASDEYRIKMEGQRDGGSVEQIFGSYSSYEHPVDEEHLRILVEKLKANSDESAVLCRTNKECGAVREALKEAGIDFVSSNKPKATLDYLESALRNDYLLEWLSSMLEARDYGDYLRMSALQENPDIKWFLANYGRITKIADAVSKVKHIRDIAAKDIHPADKFEQITKLLRVKTKCKFEGDEFTTSKEIIESIKAQISEQQENRIYVGTIHSSKGLEYNTVYVMGVNDKMFELGSEEMNNLYYVAITRARNHLIVFKR